MKLALVRHVLTGDVKEVVVTHRDRLARIGYDLIQFLFEQFGTKLVVVGANEKMGGAPESNEQLTQDLMSIVHVYSCREYGRRGHRSRRQSIHPPGPLQDASKEHAQECI